MIFVSKYQIKISKDGEVMAFRKSVPTFGLIAIIPSTKRGGFGFRSQHTDFEGLNVFGLLLHLQL